MINNKSYIIKDNQVIATCNKTQSRDAYCAYDTVEEKINKNRTVNLVNRFSAKISNAKKWEKKAILVDAIALEVNLNEYYIKG